MAGMLCLLVLESDSQSYWMLLYVDPACQLAVHVFNCVGNSSTFSAEFVCGCLFATVGMVAWFLEVR